MKVMIQTAKDEIAKSFGGAVKASRKQKLALWPAQFTPRAATEPCQKREIRALRKTLLKPGPVSIQKHVVEQCGGKSVWKIRMGWSLPG